jgi:hypothetical protein
MGVDLQPSSEECTKEADAQTRFPKNNLHSKGWRCMPLHIWMSMWREKGTYCMILAVKLRVWSRRVAAWIRGTTSNPQEWAQTWFHRYVWSQMHPLTSNIIQARNVITYPGEWKACLTLQKSASESNSRLYVFWQPLIEVELNTSKPIRPWREEQGRENSCSHNS